LRTKMATAMPATMSTNQSHQGMPKMKESVPTAISSEAWSESTPPAK
jgi:hypothetical protein